MNRYTQPASIILFIVALLGMMSIHTTAIAQVIPGRYIVVFKGDVATPGAVATSLARAHGLNITHTYSSALRGFAADVPAGMLAALQQDPRVAFIEPDLVATAFNQPLPTGINRIDADLNCKANINGIDDRVDVDIAIIDTGIDLAHPDLNVVFNRSFITGIPTGDDDHGHGTHVAGTAAALDNTIGVVGVAPGAKLWALKVLNSSGFGSFANVIAAIDFVTQNASQIEVVNMSLGGTSQLNSLRTAIQNSVNAGVVYVVAAGNSRQDVYGPDGVFPSNDDTIPAAYPEVATISAMGDTDGQAGGLGSNTSYGTADDTFASFTNFSRSVVAGNPVNSSGAAIDLAAPGVDILSTWKNGGYNTISGTSMASPHVAGAVALYIAANGRATNAAGVYAIRQALINAAQPQTAWRPSNPNDPDANPEGLANANPIPADLVLTNQTINTTQTCQATNSITVGPALVIAPPGDVTLRAGNFVRFVPGFTAQPSSKLSVYIEPVGAAASATIAAAPSLPALREKMVQPEGIVPTEQEISEKITETTLLPNYPNPFNPETWIPFAIAQASEVKITIYDVRGRLIRRIPLGYQAAGIYDAKSKAAYWDGRSDTGERVGSGMYFYRLQAGNFQATRKMVVVK
ncbi:S8 family serine peptidase [Candidatus Poribacteria bacterium]|nr:S8 family serine peptidase [Candidatus Poribacteria bacterium]